MDQIFFFNNSSDEMVQLLWNDLVNFGDEMELPTWGEEIVNPPKIGGGGGGGFFFRQGEGGEVARDGRVWEKETKKL